MEAVVRKIYRFLPYRFRLAWSLADHRAYSPPRVVQVEATNLCNLRCVMCDRWKWAKEDRSASKDIDTLKLLSLFDELAAFGVQRILLTGGEPMLRGDICTLIGRISDLKMGTTIFTNGTLIDHKKAQTLANADAAVSFSVDGVAETHDSIRGVSGSFDRALVGIQSLVQARKEGKSKCSVSVNFTVQRSNVEDVVSILGVANKVGVDSLTYNLVHGKPDMAPDEQDLRRLKVNFRKLEEVAASCRTRVIVGDVLQAFLRGELPLGDVSAGLPSLSLFKNAPVPCLAAYTTSFVDGFGRVFPCCFCYLDNFSFEEFREQRRRFQMGSVLEASFSDIWFGDAYDRFRAETDPVDADSLSFFCGQCHNYFAFRQSAAGSGVLSRLKRAGKRF